MNKSMLAGVGIGIAAALGIAAVASLDVFSSGPQYAQVIAATPIKETIKTPRQECRNVTVTHRAPVQDENRIALHLRSAQRHLNSPSAQKALTEALSGLHGMPVELTIIEDDNPAVRTPLEWRQAIYEEKLAHAREAIIADNNIQTLRRFFDADLDEESIRPL